MNLILNKDKSAVSTCTVRRGTEEVGARRVKLDFRRFLEGHSIMGRIHQFAGILAVAMKDGMLDSVIKRDETNNYTACVREPTSFISAGALTLSASRVCARPTLAWEEGCVRLRPRG